MVAVHASGELDSSQAVLGAMVDAAEKKGVKVLTSFFKV